MAMDIISRANEIYRILETFDTNQYMRVEKYFRWKPLAWPFLN